MAAALVVLAHPLDTSLSHYLASIAVSALSRAGHDATLLDLGGDDFDPRMTAAERESYYGAYDTSKVTRESQLLQSAEILVLVFPTWWFSFPALMKGFIDPVFAPGVAFDHAADLGSIKPKLHRLRHTVVITTLGSPWWIDNLVMWRPVRRIVRWGILKPCAPKSTLSYLAFYKSENPGSSRVSAFVDRVTKVMSRP